MNTTKRVALGSMLGALLTVQQIVLAVLPSISLTGFLVIVFATKLDWKTNIYVIVTYLISRNIYFGSPISVWVLYVIVFGGTSIIISSTKKWTGNIYWASFFGFMMGPAIGVVSAFTFYFLGGMSGSRIEIIPYLIRGIPFDAIHSGSNLVIIGTLYYPVCKIMDRLLEDVYEKEKRLMK